MLFSEGLICFPDLGYVQRYGAYGFNVSTVIMHRELVGLEIALPLRSVNNFFGDHRVG